MFILSLCPFLAAWVRPEEMTSKPAGLGGRGGEPESAEVGDGGLPQVASTFSYVGLPQAASTFSYVGS